MAGEVLIGSAYLNAKVTEISIYKPTFAIKEKEKEEYKIKVFDDEKNTLFLIKSTSTSFHKQRVLVDSSGKTIVTLRMKWKTMHQRWKAFRGASTEAKDLIFTAKKSSMAKYFEDFDLQVCWGHSDRVSYKVNRSFQIYKANAEYIMAKVNGDTVKVYPNVDMAFIMSLIAIVDAMIVQKAQGQTAELVVWKKVRPVAKLFLPHTWLSPSNLVEVLKLVQ